MSPRDLLSDLWPAPKGGVHALVRNITPPAELPRDAVAESGPQLPDIMALVEAFFDQIGNGAEEIYNEPSLQHELGLHLRTALRSCGWKIQFERPTDFFNLKRCSFRKREIDLSLLGRNQLQRIAIELKYPRNGQYPEQMFKFCHDIAFLEQLVAAGFAAGFFIVAAEDPLFFSGPNDTGIYRYFRGSTPLTGTIMKPTGKKDEAVRICGSYLVEWREVPNLHYATVAVRPSEAERTSGGTEAGVGTPRVNPASGGA